MTDLTVVQKLAVWVVPVLFAITVHEVAHGRVARWYGDATAMLRGRLTLNPLKHIDPVGTILVPALLIFTVGVAFGWAKPVPVDWRNLRSPKKDMIWVALAGPGANLLMAIGWVLVLKAGLIMMPWLPGLGRVLMYMGTAGVFINAIVMIINLLPIPPLDGGRVLTGLLPISLARPFARLERWGLFIIAALLLSGVLGSVILPLVTIMVDMLLSLTAIEPSLFIWVMNHIGPQG